ncbi:MAG: GIY-YIG nuclease family protein [Bacteroidia bacterium]|nr:GIY-YIG nuclease family protein [Bacteroidia bacterium]
MFAVVDIETTGTRPDKDRITEIAILLHDGVNVVKRYSSLVNPECRIPMEISRLTGITDDMVRDAPPFYKIAKDIVEMTQDAVFVAHNVRFDYGFIKSAFRDLGYMYQRKTLCTVRLSRKTFKGLASYSLGRLCESLDIRIKDRHRATGDAEATAILLSRIIERQGISEKDWLAEETIKTVFPPLLNEEVYKLIPEGLAGVYYFLNKDGFVIYVGKAIDIKKRLAQHFAISGKESAKAIQMKQEIADIKYEVTGNELLALLLESDEIKRIRPIYNVMQKRSRPVPFFGIFTEYDQLGYINFSISKLKYGDEPMSTADNMHSARELLQMMVERYQLCLSKCDLHKMPGPCFNYQLHKCEGACVQKETPEIFNSRALKAIERHSFQKESFMILGNGRKHGEQSVVCIERGQYKGFGYIESEEATPDFIQMRACIKAYPHNRDIQQILCTYLRGKTKKIPFPSQSESA